MPDARLSTDLLLDPFGTNWRNAHVIALAAESSRLGGLWTWDHLMGGVHQADNVLECWTVLSALAAITRRVFIGPLTLSVANRHPGLVAVMAPTLQHVSGGRQFPGLGAGGGASSPYAACSAAFVRDVPPDPVRRRQVEEAVAVFRQVWSAQLRHAPGEYFPLGEARGSCDRIPYRR